MTPEERDHLWTKIYGTLKKSIDNREDFSIIMAFNELIGSDSFKDPDEYSLVIQRDQYHIFMENFLIWSESMERYELCIEVKNYIEILSEWDA